MRISFTTDQGVGADNEDAVVAGDGWAVVLDGATAEPDTDSGCVHGVAWFARRLAGHLAARLLAGGALTDLLHDAITAVALSHVDTCDLANPCSPTATAAVLRRAGDRLDYLVLGDSPIVFTRVDGTPLPIVDDRLARYTGPWSGLRHIRNVPGGFWIAGAVPEAARHAVTGSVRLADVRSAALLTDGATRLVDKYGWTWPELLAVLHRGGPAELVALTRSAERDSPLAGKPHDDATAVLCAFSAAADGHYPPA
ncbi:protein phosphatase 2C domain-containing protein [Actinosynnema sp. NPDC020468]|uniref:protein phosphatase 2C domain-containing protein n=1 Tax=Actinosynnema sp. NPDC020468 TaxID=3154488 RepID=UPI0033C1F568